MEVGYGDFAAAGTIVVIEGETNSMNRAVQVSLFIERFFFVFLGVADILERLFNF